jgi:hypothetical protein
MRNILARLGVPTYITFMIAGCGTFVPEIQEFPGSSVDGQLLVHAIVNSIHCEIRNAVTYVIDQDKKVAQLNHGIRSAAWLEKWGAQVGLTLTVEEKTSVNPTSVLTPVGPLTTIFTLGNGINLSTDATRTDKINYYYTVKELYAERSCPDDANANAPPGSLLIQSDLKLREWLLSQVLEVGTGEVTLPTGPNSILKQNVLSHEVKFEVISSGNVTPAWKLITVNVNQNGTFFTTSRDRTHDLLITLGPVDPSTRQLTGAAAASYLASQIGLAVSNNLRNPVLP